MKSNHELGYTLVHQKYITSVRGGCYELGKKGPCDWRAYGYEWHGEQDASREFAHHVVCGRGKTAEEAIHACVSAAQRAGSAGAENGCAGLTAAECARLLDEWLEALQSDMEVTK